MDLQPLLDLVQQSGPDEFQEAVTQARKGIESIVGYIDSFLDTNSRADSAQTTAALDALSTGLNVSPAAALTPAAASAYFFERSSIRTVLDELEATVQGMLVACRSGGATLPEHLQEFRTALQNHAHALQRLQIAHALSARRRKFAVRAIIVASIACTAWATAYFRWQDGLEHVSTEIIFPPGPFAEITEPAKCISAVPLNRAEYLHEFSKFYFGKQSKFDALYLEGDPRDDVLRALPVPDAAPAPPAPAADPSASISHHHFKNASLRTQSISGPSDEELRGVMICQRTKTFIRNRSHLSSMFISTLQVAVVIETPKPFPWDELTLAPSLIVRPTTSRQPGYQAAGQARPTELFGNARPTALPMVLVENEGIAPVIDCSWIIRSRGGILIKSGRLGFLHGYPCPVEFPIVGETVSPRRVAVAGTRVPIRPRDVGKNVPNAIVRPVVSKDGTKLVDPMFRPVRSDEEIDPARPEFFEHRGEWYEQITSVERLRAFTEVAFDEPFELEFTCAGLDGRRYIERYEDDLPDNFCFYVRSTGLFENDPRNEVEMDARRGASAAAAASWPERMARVFSPPESDPKGVDLVSAQAYLDLTGICGGMGRTITVPVDRFLDPRGSIALYTTLKHAPTGRYRFTILASGEVVHECYLEIMNPEVLELPHEVQARSEEIIRLRNAFESRQRSTFTTRVGEPIDGG